MAPSIVFRSSKNDTSNRRKRSRITTRKNQRRKQKRSNNKNGSRDAITRTRTPARCLSFLHSGALFFPLFVAGSNNRFFPCSIAPNKNTHATHTHTRTGKLRMSSPIYVLTIHRRSRRRFICNRSNPKHDSIPLAKCDEYKNGIKSNESQQSQFHRAVLCLIRTHISQNKMKKKTTKTQHDCGV